MSTYQTANNIFDAESSLGLQNTSYPLHDAGQQTSFQFSTFPRFHVSAFLRHLHQALHSLPKSTEPNQSFWKEYFLVFRRVGIYVRYKGIEPLSSAWKAEILPLNQQRFRKIKRYKFYFFLNEKYFFKIFYSTFGTFCNLHFETFSFSADIGLLFLKNKM